MDLFTKASVESILQSKRDSNEISAYFINDIELHIKVGRRGKVGKIDISNLSGKELISVLYSKISKDVEEHFKREIRNIKIRRIIND